MDKVAKLNAVQRRELFSETAARMNLLPGLIEKDFWVCWTLKHLFSIPEFESHLLFKGGTTLSKIFRVIQRFSEDIDLAVDWEMLGFRGERSPQAEMSATKRGKLLGSVKYEEVYLKDYRTVGEASSNLGRYFSFYDNIRLHQSLEYRTPAAVYQS